MQCAVLVVLASLGLLGGACAHQEYDGVKKVGNQNEYSGPSRFVQQSNIETFDQIYSLALTDCPPYTRRQPVVVDAGVKRQIRVFLAIKVRAGGFRKREQIRQRLLSHRLFRGEDPPFVARFFAAVDPLLSPELVKAEIAQYGDVVVFGYHDKYANLGQKVFSFYEYAIAHHSVDCVFQIDDDTFLNPDHLYYGILSQVDLSRRIYFGRMRDLDARGSIAPASGPVTVAPLGFWWTPGWLTGMTVPLVREVLRGDGKAFTYSRKEDVALGRLVSRIADVTYYMVDTWYNGVSGYLNSESGVIDGGLLATDKQVEWLYKRQEGHGRLGEADRDAFIEEFYDSVKPSRVPEKSLDDPALIWLLENYGMLDGTLDVAALLAD